jgi:ribosomal 50S subunit-recycling heat shock protein
VRLDLFLKASRLVKRRTAAQEACEACRVWVNGLEAKSAKEVKSGDRITLLYNANRIELEVLDMPVSSKKNDLGLLYRVIAETSVEREDKA